MALLSRKEFVQICTQAILYTRNKVAIQNQVSGYKQYHREIKENDYFILNVRLPLAQSRDDEYMYRHDLIEHTGLGNCSELADFLLVEIGKAIAHNHARARICITSAQKYDHVYLEIKIGLAGEENESLWEVDAWDPRIIDITTRPDGTIKNHDSLDYGYSTIRQRTIYTDQINYSRRYQFFTQPKPEPGTAREMTPEDMILQRPHMYSDYTVADACQAGKLDPSGEIHYLQKSSSWQRR